MKKRFFLLTSCLILTGFFNLALAQCGTNIIYVDLQLIKDDNLTFNKWITKYPKTKVCKVNGDEITVDLGAFADLNYVPEWLRENSGYIDFRKSLPVIEKSHLLAAGNPLIALAKTNIDNGDEITYDYNAMIIFFDPYYTLDKMAQSEYYRNYKLIDRDNNGDMIVYVIPEFYFNKFCFSAPLLKSIIKTYITAEDIKGEYKNCNFTFTIVTDAGKEHAVMRFQHGTDAPTYYNFSDEPGTSKFFGIRGVKTTNAPTKALTKDQITEIIKRML